MSPGGPQPSPLECLGKQRMCGQDAPLCAVRLGFLQKMLEGGWTESHQCIQDVGSVELTKDVSSALLGQSGIAELSLCS